VIIDAGHGGKDNGATSPHSGQREKDLALDTAMRIRNELSRDFKVILMRSDDNFIDLDERVLRANRSRNAILISMHYNSGPSSCRGPETYYWRVDSHGLASRLPKPATAAWSAAACASPAIRKSPASCWKAAT
jgi:N-acetylmuramoyl-L-alanine amidase